MSTPAPLPALWSETVKHFELNRGAQAILEGPGVVVMSTCMLNLGICAAETSTYQL